MTRLYILIALSLPLAAAPVLACDMELADDSVSLADLLDEVDRAGDAANAASVAGEQASKVEPSTDSEAESPVDDPPPVEEATTSVHDLLRELGSRALAARPSPEDAVVTDATSGLTGWACISYRRGRLCRPDAGTARRRLRRGGQRRDPLA